MTRRKTGPFYDLWHRRVEGQLRHAIGQHPEWFNVPDETAKSTLVNSLAKRIVGEIAAAYHVAPGPVSVPSKCDDGNGGA